MSTISSVQLNNSPVFKESNVNKTISDDVSSDLVKSPKADEFKSEAESKPKKKRNLAGKIALGVISAIALTYGGVVLHRKLSKPTFEEVQKCFKEIFQKDLSDSEVKELIEKYKQICKNDKTEEFTQKIIEQLKKDYGLEQVKTNLNIEKLKDDSLKTALERKKAGSATPLGEINIMPNTSTDRVIRSVQGETFSTGFHELKHLKQFSEAYRTDPDKFAEAMLNLHINNDSAGKKAEFIKEYKDTLFNKYTELKNGNKEAIKEFKMSEKDIKETFKLYSIDDLIKMTIEQQGLKTDEDIFNYVKKQKIKGLRDLLDAQYGKLERFKEGSAEYKKGMEYIKGYETYPDAEKDYEAYRKNILEKEAWDVGEQAQKIYKYMSSIWKI